MKVMPWNAGPYRSNSSASHRLNSAAPLPGSVHKQTPHTAAMHKSRRSPGNSFTSLSEPNTPPRGTQFAYYDPSGDNTIDDDEALASPDSVGDRPAFLDVERGVNVEPAQRRSSYLAEGMLKEHLSCDKVGRDKDGHELYVMRLVESHGFRWNRFLHRMASTDSPRSEQVLIEDPGSDCFTTDEDENDVFERVSS